MEEIQKEEIKQTLSKEPIKPYDYKPDTKIQKENHPPSECIINPYDNRDKMMEVCPPFFRNPLSEPFYQPFIAQSSQKPFRGGFRKPAGRKEKEQKTSDQQILFNQINKEVNNNRPNSFIKKPEYKLKEPLERKPLNREGRKPRADMRNGEELKEKYEKVKSDIDEGRKNENPRMVFEETKRYIVENEREKLEAKKADEDSNKEKANDVDDREEIMKEGEDQAKKENSKKEENSDHNEDPAKNENLVKIENTVKEPNSLYSEGKSSEQYPMKEKAKLHSQIPTSPSSSKIENSSSSSNSPTPNLFPAYCLPASTIDPLNAFYECLNNTLFYDYSSSDTFLSALETSTTLPENDAENIVDTFEESDILEK
jgi:hypothetical protein